jgi:hypothetical protein
MLLRLRRLVILPVVAWALASCGGNSGTSLLVVTPDPPSSHSVAQAKAADPECRPMEQVAATAVHSDLHLSGPCAFTEKSVGRCVKRVDDFYVYLAHDLTGEGRFILTVNVENYHGPGEYKSGAEVYLEITRNNQFYYWSVRHTTVTVTEQSPPHVDIASASLPAQAGTPARGTQRVSGVVACPSLSS